MRCDAIDRRRGDCATTVSRRISRELGRRNSCRATRRAAVAGRSRSENPTLGRAKGKRCIGGDGADDDGCKLTFASRRIEQKSE